MSRSRKKKPYANMCGGETQSEWKRIYNRRLRRCNTQQLTVYGEDAIYFTVDQKGNQWDSPYDGTKRYRGERPVSASVGRWRITTLEEAQEDWDRMMRK